MNQPTDPNAEQARYASPPQAASSPSPEAPAAAEAAYGSPRAGVLPAGMYFDQASGLTLPQGVRLASNGRRIGAYFLALPLALVTLGIGYAIWGLIVWGSGTTPALQVLGMRCWKPETRRPAGWGTMALREIIGRLVDGIFVITFLVSFILMLTRPDRRSLHDLVASTVVVHDPDKILSSTGP
jgi:uncharacterized RDD family membrane protein YckC